MDNCGKDMTCKFARHLVEGVYCHKREKGKRIDTAAKCENCDMYKSKYITYPIQVDEIEVKECDKYSLEADLIGKPVTVCPCADRFEGKTYLGIFLGDLPFYPTVSYNEKDKKLTVGTMKNPAIFIPEKKEIVYGAESFWSSDIDIKEISDDLIKNQWYMKALASMCAETEPPDNVDKEDIT